MNRISRPRMNLLGVLDIKVAIKYFFVLFTLITNKSFAFFLFIGLGYLKIIRSKHNAFSIHWIAFPVLSCFSISFASPFFCLTFLILMPLPWSRRTNSRLDLDRCYCNVCLQQMSPQCETLTQNLIRKEEGRE